MYVCIDRAMTMIMTMPYSTYTVALTHQVHSGYKRKTQWEKKKKKKILSSFNQSMLVYTSLTCYIRLSPPRATASPKAPKLSRLHYTTTLQLHCIAYTLHKSPTTKQKAKQREKGKKEKKYRDKLKTHVNN